MKTRTKHIIGVFTLTVLSWTAFGQTENYWTRKADFGGWDRERACAFSVGNAGYVCGGQDTAEVVHNDLWSYDPGSDSWSQKASLPGPVRRNALAFTIDSKGYVGTGVDSAEASTGTILQDFWEFDPATNSWTQKADYPGGGNSGVYFATGFGVGGYGFICAGKIAPSTYVFDMWRYDPVSDSWTPRSFFPGGLRNKLCSFVVFGKAYVGLGEDEDIYRKDWWEYDPQTDSWSQKQDFPAGGRANVSTFAVGMRGYVFGGENGGYQEDLWEYNPFNDSWSIRDQLPGQERRYAVGFSIGQKGYVGMGQGPQGIKKSFYEYTPYQHTLSVPETKSSFDIYPNPANDILRVNGKFESIELYDLSGQLLMNLQNPEEINVEGFSPGNYIIKIRSGNGISIKKLVICH